MRDQIRTVLANLAVVLGLLVGIEAGIRAFGPDIRPVGTDRRLIADSVYGSTAGLAPGAAGYSNGAWFEVGPDGFWRYAGGPARGPGWLFLGDSVTMGLGVDPDSTFAGRVAASGVRVLNPSLIGYSIDDYARVLSALLPRGDVDRVTLFWCLNDIYTGDVATGDPGGRVRMFGGPLFRFVQRHYRTYQVAKAIALDRPRSYFEYVRRQYGEASVRETSRRIAAMARASEEAGARFEVVLLPYGYQLRQPGNFGPQVLLETALRSDSVDVVDASGHLLDANVDPSGIYLYGDGIHFSKTGHRLLAEFIMDRAFAD